MVLPQKLNSPRIICDIGELAIRSAACVMKASAPGTVKLEGKLKGSLSRQKANPRLP